jgi:hypothetical protein
VSWICLKGHISIKRNIEQSSHHEQPHTNTPKTPTKKIGIKPLFWPAIGRGVTASEEEALMLQIKMDVLDQTITTQY